MGDKITRGGLEQSDSFTRVGGEADHTKTKSICLCLRGEMGGYWGDFHQVHDTVSLACIFLTYSLNLSEPQFSHYNRLPQYHLS
jgi:hypothetical protein